MGKTSDGPRLADVRQLGVFLGSRRVGTLARTPDGLAAFGYDADWLRDGFSISPLSLPLESRVFVPEVEPFDGLFGVFQDSLPDGWGALLLDRMLREHGYDPASIAPMTRLAVVGSGGRGGLRYEPEAALSSRAPADEDLDALAETFGRIAQGLRTENLDEAYALGGSSGGARPKAYLHLDGSEWIVKFPSGSDPSDAGEMEYAYSVAARECGVKVPRTRLFASRTCSGYFGVERFDRTAQGEGVHMVSASGILEVSHRLPLLDYRHLFQVSAVLTHDDVEQAWGLFRLMCFNVFAHNQDDHSNNFAWLCESGTWRLSPAYDLTYSTAFGGEHSTTVNGRGNPGLDDVMALADEAGLPHGKALAEARRIRSRCEELLRTVRRARDPGQGA